MSVKVGWWGVGSAASIGAGAAWLLEWPPAASAAVGALLVPLVALAAAGVLPSRRTAPGAEAPPRGLCECGHPMSLHCGSDGAGPCAGADCRCAGREQAVPAQ
jgi:hypothetical protein